MKYTFYSTKNSHWEYVGKWPDGQSHWTKEFIGEVEASSWDEAYGKILPIAKANGVPPSHVVYGEALA